MRQKHPPGAEVTEDSRRVSDAEINAFVDGVLEADREAEIMAAIAADPELSARVLAYQYQNTGLRALYDHYLEEPVPEHVMRPLREAPPRAAARSAGWRPTVLKAAVLVGVFVLGTATGVGGYMTWLSPPFLLEGVVKQAVLAHQVLEAERPGAQRLFNEAGDVIDNDLVTAGFEVPLRVPAMTNVDNFQPVSFRNIAGTTGPTAQIMYRDAKERDISLYIRPHSATTTIPFETAMYEGYEVIYWIDGPLAYVLVGRDIGETALARMARAVYGARALAREDESAIDIKSSAPPSLQPVQQGQ